MIVGIRGLGLIGGSFEKAFIERGDRALNLKGADASLISSCDLIIVALPPLMVAPWISEHAADFKPGAIITDVAGVKRVVLSELEETAKRANWTYIGGHPMAGKERCGYAMSDAKLYKGASMILTPYEWTPSEKVEELKSLMLSIGFARVVVTTPEHHDEMIAYTSQLAHVVSSAYVQDPIATGHMGFSAGSFQDMTRVAVVEADIWNDLFLSNKDDLSIVLGRLIERLTTFKRAIDSSDSETLKALLKEGKRIKELSK